MAQNEVSKDIDNLTYLAFKDLTIYHFLKENPPTYEAFPYSYTIVCQGVTADMIPIVTFDIETLELHSLAPVAKAIDGGVIIYSSENLDASEIPVKIPSIVCYSSKGGT